MSECPVWEGLAPDQQDGDDRDDVDPEEILLPWSGNSMGSDDLSFVAGRSAVKVVSIVGPQNAGKTTLLAAWFLLLGRGVARPDGYRFAGSYTLEGWENIAHSLRWPGDGGPTFPPHTSSGGGRVPGLLHLGLRHRDGALNDFLFADAPGEWFRAWGLDREAAGAEGARWLGEHADVFLLMADCESLVGAGRGTARDSLRLLAQRLGAERGDRPVALVWSKSDISPAPEIRDAIRQVISRELPSTPEFEISVRPVRTIPSGEDRDPTCSLLAVLDWAVSARRPSLGPRSNTLTTGDPFLAYGRP